MSNRKWNGYKGDWQDEYGEYHETCSIDVIRGGKVVAVECNHYIKVEAGIVVAETIIIKNGDVS